MPRFYIEEFLTSAAVGLWFMGVEMAISVFIRGTVQQRDV